MNTRTEANLAQLASDVHLLTAPVRLLWHALITSLCVLSFPLLCALVSLHYVIGNISPIRAYCHFVTIHHIPDVLYPFALLGAFAMIPVEAVVLAVQAVAEVFDGLYRSFPLFGITLLALINSLWLLIVRAIYVCIDNDDASRVPVWWLAFFGFSVSLLGQFYVLPYRESAPLAALFLLVTGASASPALLYLLYRAFKPNACR